MLRRLDSSGRILLESRNTVQSAAGMLEQIVARYIALGFWRVLGLSC